MDLENVDIKIDVNGLKFSVGQDFWVIGPIAEGNYDITKISRKIGGLSYGYGKAIWISGYVHGVSKENGGRHKIECDLMYGLFIKDILPGKISYEVIENSSYPKAKYLIVFSENDAKSELRRLKVEQLEREKGKRLLEIGKIESQLKDIDNQIEAYTNGKS